MTTQLITTGPQQTSGGRLGWLNSYWQSGKAWGRDCVAYTKDKAVPNIESFYRENKTWCHRGGIVTAVVAAYYIPACWVISGVVSFSAGTLYGRGTAEGTDSTASGNTFSAGPERKLAAKVILKKEHIEVSQKIRNDSRDRAIRDIRKLMAGSADGKKGSPPAISAAQKNNATTALEKKNYQTSLDIRASTEALKSAHSCPVCSQSVVIQLYRVMSGVDGISDKDIQNMECDAFSRNKHTIVHMCNRTKTK